MSHGKRNPCKCERGHIGPRITYGGQQIHIHDSQLQVPDANQAQKLTPGQVCWCWCFLLPSSFAFPLFVPVRKLSSHFHVHFTFIILHPHFHLIRRIYTLLGRVYVCVDGTSEQTLNFAPGLVILYYIIARGRRPVFDAAVNEDRH